MDDKKKRNGFIFVCVVAVICVAVITVFVLRSCGADTAAVTSAGSCGVESGDPGEAVTAFLDEYLILRSDGMKQDIMESAGIDDSDLSERFADLFVNGDIEYEILVPDVDCSYLWVPVTFTYPDRRDKLDAARDLAEKAGLYYDAHFDLFVPLAEGFLESAGDSLLVSETVPVSCAFNGGSGWIVDLADTVRVSLDRIIGCGVIESVREDMIDSLSAVDMSDYLSGFAEQGDDVSVSDESGLEDALSAFLDGYLDSRRDVLKSEIMDSLGLDDYRISDRYVSDFADRYADLFLADDIEYDISVEAVDGISYTADVTFYYTGRLDSLADVCAVAMTAEGGFEGRFLMFIFVADDYLEYSYDDPYSYNSMFEDETVSVSCSFSGNSGLTVSLSDEAYEDIDGVICAGVTEYYRDAILYLLREGVDGLDDFEEKFPWPEEEFYYGEYEPQPDYSGHVIDPFPDDTDDDALVPDDDLSAADSSGSDIFRWVDR